MVADTCLPEHVLDPATAFCVLPAMAVAVVAWAADAAGVLCDAAVADAVLLLLLPHPVTSSKNPATRERAAQLPGVPCRGLSGAGRVRTGCARRSRRSLRMLLIVSGRVPSVTAVGCGQVGPAPGGRAAGVRTGQVRPGFPAG